MQPIDTATTPAADTTGAPEAAPVTAPITLVKTSEQQAAKRTKRAAKPKAVSKPAPKPAAAPVADDRATERAVAATAVGTYYRGKSLPFKAASDTFRPLAVNTKAATERQAALFAVMLAADLAGNIKPDGSFTRGGFRLPARLFNPKAPASATVACQPESGCLSDANGRTISYVSGPTSGKAQRDAIYRLDLDRAASEISSKLGDKLGKLALARIKQLRAA